jgi:hypothetical protein
MLLSTLAVSRKLPTSVIKLVTESFDCSVDDERAEGFLKGPVAAAAPASEKLGDSVNTKSAPPNAKPGPTPPSATPTPAVRSNFPETWLWADTNVKFSLA